MSPETGGAGLLTAIGLLLMVGAAGKSAQIPLYVWLPDAMEGPTPVSALIHAATMVTAGVYMVARSHVIFDRAPSALTVVAIVGTLTALFAATIGIAQTDIKKVLAYSTISQLGYMFMACGVAAYSAGIFHLMTHAFFKGLLFLAAGSVIHAVGGEQDMRRMGGLRTKIPWTFWTMTMRHLRHRRHSAICRVLQQGRNSVAGVSGQLGVLGDRSVFTAFLTSFYMFRLWFLTFFGEYRGTAEDAHEHPAHDLTSHALHGRRYAAGAPAPHGHGHGHGGIHESPGVMVIPLVVLAVLSLVGGWVGIGARFEKFLCGPRFYARPVRPAGGKRLSTATSETAVHGDLGVAAALLGLVLAWLLYYRDPQLPQQIAAAWAAFIRPWSTSITSTSCMPTCS